MRMLKGGIAHVAFVIEDDLKNRETELYKSHVSGLADLVASALATRSANTSEWNAVLPRNCCEKSKERYISRILSNNLISPIQVMKGFIPEIIELCGSNNQTVVLMLDQSKICDGFECLMVSLRVSQRAIPVAWKVLETRGSIGFTEQNILLNCVAEMIPENISILLAADRFYGTSSLIEWCQKKNWDYRIRLKGNLIFQHEGGEITGNDAAHMKLQSLKNVFFNQTNISTNIGILWEDGHKEPWIVAMNTTPSKYKTLDYEMRWGIECMFSDFKSRGFSIIKTKLKHTDRIERLILILSMALIWAVSTGMQPKVKKTKCSKKNFIDQRFLFSNED